MIVGVLPLVAAKVAAPVPSATFVHRDRLYDALDRGLETRLTLVVGPAGAGKSALVAGWTDRRRGSFTRAWVNADAGDTTARLLRHVAGAVTGPAGGRADATRAGVRALLHQVPGRLVLVVDDVHLLRSRHALAELGDLAAEAPSHVHVVLVSRSDVHAATGRAGADRTEIRGADLRLTDDEVRAVVRSHGGLDADGPATAALSAKVDGWAAGLQLALAALAGRDDPEGMVRIFGGATPAVADYLVDEVLGQLDGVERELLLDLSVLDDLSAAACRRATGRDDAPALLAALADRNLLVERYTDATFRCHPLLQQLLQLRLRQGDERRFARLHRLAAGLAEDRGDLAAAVDHHLASDDPAAVLGLCRRHAGALLAAEAGPLVREWLDRLPEHRLTQPRDQVDLAALLLRTGDVAGCARWLERVRRGAEAPGPGLQRRIDELQAECHHRSGDPEGALRCARRAAVPAAEAFGRLWQGAWDEARAVLATGAHVVLDGAALDGAVLGLAARIEVEAGDLPAADRLVELALASEDPATGDGRAEDAGARLHAWTARTQLLVEALTDPDAEAAVDALVDEARRLGARDVAVVGVCLRARLQWTDICIEAGVGALGYRSVLGLDLPVGPLLQARLDRTEARLLVEAGDTVAAHRLLDRLPDGPGTEALRCRAWAAAGDVRRALDHLTALRAALAPSSPGAGAGEVALAWARVLADGGDRRAVEAAGALLRHPATRHLRRRLLEEGEGVRTALRAAGPEGAARADELDRARRLTDATTLSPRELAVLQYLPTRMTNQEIGTHLFVSANTVKTHLKNLYRRLGVSSRDAAVARACDLGLLPPRHDRTAPLTGAGRSPGPAGPGRGR